MRLSPSSAAAAAARRRLLQLLRLQLLRLRLCALGCARSAARAWLHAWLDVARLGVAQLGVARLGSALGGSRARDLVGSVIVPWRARSVSSPAEGLHMNLMRSLEEPRLTWGVATACGRATCDYKRER
jgi:hypothetical protein